MRPDQNNTQIINNYAAMPDKLMFCAKDVATATGVNLSTVRNVMIKLAKKGEIVRLAKRTAGMVYYRTAMHSEKLAAAAEDMRQNGDEYHQILSEVINAKS
jgi:DNA-binding transcriptional regulator YhcF (GntR family)